MTIIRSATACVSLLILAGCVAVPASGPSYAPAYAPVYSAPPGYSAAPVYVVPPPPPAVIYTQPAYGPPRHYEAPPRHQDRPPHDMHQERPRQGSQRPSNYSRSLGGSQTNPNVGQP